MASMADDTYPQGAKAVDDHIGERISDLSRAVTGGFERSERAFERVERTFDKMVTKSEFDATIQNVNTRIDNTDSNLESGIQAVEAKMEAGLAVVSSDLSAGFAAIAASASERNIRNRWLWGTALGIIALLSGIAFDTISAVLPK